jgi:hypothetical protein
VRATHHRDDHRVVLVEIGGGHARVWDRGHAIFFAPQETSLLTRDARWQVIEPGAGKELIDELRRGLAGSLVDDDHGLDVHPWLAGSKAAVGA